MESNYKNGSTVNHGKEYKEYFGNGKLNVNGASKGYYGAEDIDDLKMGSNLKFSERKVGGVLFAVTTLILLGKIFLSMSKFFAFYMKII